MERIYLNDEWVAEPPPSNYWQLLSYVLFIVVLFLGFYGFVADEKYKEKQSITLAE